MKILKTDEIKTNRDLFYKQKKLACWKQKVDLISKLYQKLIEIGININTK